MSALAPIALFAFKRPRHLTATLEALARNELADRSQLTIFCDGARGPEDEEQVRHVRTVARQARGFDRLELVEQAENLGLAASVISGVSALVDTHDRVIVVEDDLVTSPWFLRFMNEALDLYAATERVASINGYCFPVSGSLPETFFLPGAFCWGWATWRRAWRLFEPDGLKLLREIVRRDLVYDFDMAGSTPFSQYLGSTNAGRGDSWALRWMASVLLNDMLSLWPGRSLVSNIGMDRTGTNAGSVSTYDTVPTDRPVRVGTAPIEPNLTAFRQFRAFNIRSRRSFGLKEQLYYRLAAWLPNRVERTLYTRIIMRSLTRNDLL